MRSIGSIRIEDARKMRLLKAGIGRYSKIYLKAPKRFAQYMVNVACGLPLQI
jgi:hypothetical protein